LSERELQRGWVLDRVLEGIWLVGEAAAVLGVSERHTWRLLAAYREEGIAALAHGNRGKKPVHALPDEVKTRVVELAQDGYRGVNHCHLTELLGDREGIALSRSSVRRILGGAGIRSPRKRRPPRHRRRRERREQEGMLLQMDGSQHDWLEGRGPRLCLIGAIDDATGKVPSGLFRCQEDAQGYFLLTRDIVETHGIPQAVYHDRHGIFQRSKKDRESLEEQLAGKRQLTQFGRLMEELGITSISSMSPQARGRIERLWGTFQDRLVSELRLAGASTLEEANRVLQDFLPRFNQQFPVPAAQEGSAYRKPEKNFNPEEHFCFKYTRTVGLDNVVRLHEHRIQVLPTGGRFSYARARVEVQERMDGSIAVYYQGTCLATREAPSEAPQLRVRDNSYNRSNARQQPGPVASASYDKKASRSQATGPRAPAPDHPWRRSFKTQRRRLTFSRNT